MGWIIGGLGSGKGWEFFCLPLCPDHLWGPLSLLSSGYQGLFLWGYSNWGMKLTTNLHLVLKSRMCGAMPPLSQYAFMVWCSVKKHRDNFTFTFTLEVVI